MCRRVCQRDREIREGERGQAVTNTSRINVPDNFDGKMQMHLSQYEQIYTQTSQNYSGSRLLVLMGDS